ncbi:alpha/beta hydrolase [Romeria aff. gracilis LEGE 07310]|uniref:Alpha/beta hydrolase n=1 Tax=Vasconcelosia minhoensis LEGE 07310 TaxID=915328 RepID=A0A8J7AYA0_9CYAN|nr:alpha/beta hydrolase [Romeria gracilis]MBE9079953.1 alpha/beta hydrolase [Romeria aff. gracilis LEGE 07310]
MTLTQPDYILYAQHGWADTHRDIAALTQSVASPRAHRVTPNLGFINTWLRMAPLVDAVDAIATQTHHLYPDIPIRIIGHSMGGLIWLKVLKRHPDWWPQVESLILIGSPVSGSDLSRTLDPFQWGIGIAKDLGQNRRPLAEKIAAAIPTLTIVGDVGNASDGIVPIACSQFHRARCITLKGIYHDALKCHPEVAAAIRHYWAQPQSFRLPPLVELTERDRAIRQLQEIPGMTDTHTRNFGQARPWGTLADGSVLHTWQSPVGVHHVYLADPVSCCYAGFVGWPHTGELYRTLREMG